MDPEVLEALAPTSPRPSVFGAQLEALEHGPFPFLVFSGSLCGRGHFLFFLCTAFWRAPPPHVLSLAYPNLRLAHLK